MEKITNKIITGIILALCLYIGFLFYQGHKTVTEEKTLGKNVSTENGEQILEVTAKGGYSPTTINAKSNAVTILRIKTENTFDCSSSLVIPKIGIRKNLPANGTTDINIPPQEKGTTIAAACSMGMYRFNINFN